MTLLRVEALTAAIWGVTATPNASIAETFSRSRWRSTRSGSSSAARCRDLSSAVKIDLLAAPQDGSQVAAFGCQETLD